MHEMESFVESLLVELFHANKRFMPSISSDDGSGAFISLATAYSAGLSFRITFTILTIIAIGGSCLILTSYRHKTSLLYIIELISVCQIFFPCILPLPHERLFAGLHSFVYSLSLHSRTIPLLLGNGYRPFKKTQH